MPNLTVTSASRRTTAAVALLVLVAILSGCASHRTLSVARDEEKKGHLDLAVLKYAKAHEMSPDDPKILMALMRAKMTASQDHFRKGKTYRASGHLDLAIVELRMATSMDPTNQFAQSELDKALQDKQEIVALGRQKTPLERLKEKTKGAQIEPPRLNPQSKSPISISFPEEKNVKDIYTAIAKGAGINVLFDPQLKDQKVTVELKDVSLQRALEIIMRQSGHFYKVLDQETIIIAADTPQNRKDYEDLVIKTFFLSSGDVKEVMNVLRTLIEARRIAMNQQLNAIVLRDTVDKVAVAERIINANDKAKAEVIVDVELMQVNSNRLREIGVEMTTSTISQSLVQNSADGETASGSWSWDDLLEINRGNWLFSNVPGFLYSFLKNNGESTLLAKPQLRITEGEKATLTIGDRVPIPTTTFNTQGTIGGTVVPITSFQYQDVGIKIDIEPRVHHNREVTLKLTIEVSQLGASIDVGNGQGQPSIGTRTITSIIRLKDGESNFLAGLIRTDEQTSKSGVPFLMDIPILGKLFSKNRSSQQRTDILLTLTPHIVRMPDISEEDLLPVWVGTENNITFHGTSTRIESPATETPFGEVRPLVSRPPFQPPSTSFRDHSPAAQVPEVPVAPGGGVSEGLRKRDIEIQQGSDGAVRILDDPEREPDRLRPVGGVMPAVLRLVGPEAVRPGVEFTLEPRLMGGDGVDAFEASLVYDATLLELISATSTSDGLVVEAIPGVIRLLWRSPGPGAVPSGVFTFRSFGIGSTQLMWSGGAGVDRDGAALTVALHPAFLVVDPEMQP